MNKSFNSPKWVSVLFSFFVLFAVVFSAGKAVAGLFGSDSENIKDLAAKLKAGNAELDKAKKEYENLVKQMTINRNIMAKNRVLINQRAISNAHLDYIRDFIKSGKTCTEWQGKAPTPSSPTEATPVKGQALNATNSDRSPASAFESSTAPKVEASNLPPFSERRWKEVCPAGANGLGKSISVQYLCSKKENITHRGIIGKFDADICTENLNKFISELTSFIASRAKEPGLWDDVDRAQNVVVDLEAKIPELKEAEKKKLGIANKHVKVKRSRVQLDEVEPTVDVPASGDARND